MDDFRRHELRCAKHDPRLDAGFVVACQTEVDDLDPVPRPTQTQNVLRLHSSHSANSELRIDSLIA